MSFWRRLSPENYLRRGGGTGDARVCWSRTKTSQQNDFGISVCRRVGCRRQYPSRAPRFVFELDRVPTPRANQQKSARRVQSCGPDRQAFSLAQAHSPMFGHTAPLLSLSFVSLCGSHYLLLIRSTPMRNLLPTSRSEHKKSEVSHQAKKNLSDTQSWSLLSPLLFFSSRYVAIGLASSQSVPLCISSSSYQRSVYAWPSGIIITADYPCITSP